MNNKTVIAVICFFTVSTPCLAEITTDGTIGAAGKLSGPQFHIGQELGSLRGNNLFHSFGRFNLNSSESATFTGNSQIQNVISRVTGGAGSNIDGTLKSEIGSAAFYFINPAGIVFGQHAQIDVPGAFYASTAGELKFADGSSFSAVNPQGNTLSMAAPDAFGFLGKQTGAIALNGAELVFKPGTAVNLSAGKITMDKASLKGEGMDLQLASVGTEKQEVGVASLSENALAGAISINDSVLDASGNGKGRIAVRAGDVKALNSQINANNMGNLDMPANQGINMRVGGLNLYDTDITSDTNGGNSGTVNVSVQNELKQIKGSSILTATVGQGNAGKVTVKAGKIFIDGQNTGTITGIVSEARKGSSGNAGAIKVSVDQELMLNDSGLISSRTFGKGGDAGNVLVNARNIEINGKKSDFATGIYSDTKKGSIGNAGKITVNIQESLSILNSGAISSSTRGIGNGGTVNVNAEAILITNRNHLPFATGIFSDVEESSLRGNAGKITVNATKSLTLLSGGTISSSTFGKGNAGIVAVKAAKATIDGEKSDFATGIFTSSDKDESGDAGSLNLSIDGELLILNKGYVSSGTQGKGNGGSVNVNAETIRINKTIDSSFETGINSDVSENAEGNPGSIHIHATKLLSMRGGIISINSGLQSNNVTKNNPKITIDTPQLDLSNDSAITALSTGTLPASPIEINTSRLSMDHSQITTTANQSDGGPITINAKDWAQLKNSLITTSVGNSEESLGTNIGNGGDININTDVLVLDTGFIQANTNATNANGGNINLNVKQLVASSGNLQSGGNTPLTFIPNSGLNVIQAAAPNGIKGNITNTAPQLNIVGALAGLNTPQLDLSRVGHDPCSSTVQQSTMKKLGKGGIPYFNKGQDGYTLDRLLPNKQDRPSETTNLSMKKPDSHDCQPKTKHPRPQDVTKQAG